MNLFFLCLIIIFFHITSSIRQVSKKNFGTYIYQIDEFNQTKINNLISNIIKFNVDILYFGMNTARIKNDIIYKSNFENNLYIFINTLIKGNAIIPKLGFLVLEDPNFTYLGKHNIAIEQIEILNNFTIPIMNYINQTSIPALIDTEYWLEPGFNKTENGTDNSTLSNQFFVLLKRIHYEVKPRCPRLKFEVYHSIYTTSFLFSQTEEDLNVQKSYTYVLANRHYTIINQYLEYYRSKGFKYYIDLDNSNQFQSKDNFFNEVNKYASEILKSSEGIIVYSLFNY